MTDGEARIKLAEAMGYSHDEWGNEVDGERVFYFQPFTDANHDYAVLEWMRTFKGVGIKHKHWGRWTDFLKYLPSRLCDYHVGDFARAALKVIEDD